MKDNLIVELSSKFALDVSIASKEAREVHRWLRLARDSRILDQKETAPLLEQIASIRRILTSIVKSTH